MMMMKIWRPTSDGVGKYDDGKMMKLNVGNDAVDKRWLMVLRMIMIANDDNELVMTKKMMLKTRANNDDNDDEII